MDLESPLPPDPYAALGLTKDAAAASIKSAYRKLALKCHPDKVTDEALKQQSVDEFHKIQQAYDIIGDEDKRARHDALVRLSSLRRQNVELREGPSGGVRTAAYDVRAPTAARPVYATNRPTKFEERRPKFADEDDFGRGAAAKYADYEYASKRPTTAVPLRTERVRVDPRGAEERKRTERRREREADVRESRSRKYDVPDGPYAARYEEDRRRRDDEERQRRKADDSRRDRVSSSTERKYADVEQTAQRYMERGTRPVEVRPSARRASTREVPLAVRRSQAPPKANENERDREILMRERAQREKDRIDMEREKDRLERERERPRDRGESEKPRTREREPTVAPAHTFERRPPGLSSHKSSPPLMSQSQPSVRESREPREPKRSYTESSADAYQTGTMPAPTFQRASTMPAYPSSNTSARRAKEPYPPQPSKLRESIPLDSGYSSPSTAIPDAHAAQAERAAPTSHPVKEKRYHYPSDSTDSSSSSQHTAYAKGRRTEIREPATSTSSRKERSLSRERPSSTASKMAHLANASPRISARSSMSYGTDLPAASSGSRPSLSHAATTRAVPTMGRERSLDRSSRRERDTDRESDRGRETRRDRDYPRVDKYYGERGQGHVRGESFNGSPYGVPKVSFGKRYDYEDISFSPRESGGGRERERNPYDNYPPTKPVFYRSSTLPVVY
jgi:curved DNA-binding protein CbpA